MKNLECIFIIILIFFVNINFINTQEENKNKIQNENNNEKSQEIISRIELSHFTPITYTSGANMPGFFYGFAFTYILPLKSEHKFFKQNNFNVNLYNQTFLTMDKIGIGIGLAPLPFLEFNSGFSSILIWDGKSLKKGESLNDTEGEKTEGGMGFNFDLGINLKFGFNYFFPKFKLGFMNRSLFNYILFPGINFWEFNQYKTMLRDGWIFSNDLMIIWNERIFVPYLVMNTTCFFEKLNNVSLSVGGGIQLNFD